MRLYLFIFLFLFSKESSAQKAQLDFNLVTAPNGKPFGHPRNVTQDPQGYIWIAAQEGKCIYRYDGNRFTIFRHDDANPNSLGGAGILSVYADDAGMIWVGLGEGLDQYNPATGIFKHYRHSPNDPGSLSGGLTMCPVLKDRQDRLWVGTGNGLDRLDEKTGKFIHYRNEPGNPKSLSSNVVWKIYEDRQGVIWIGTGYPFVSDEDGGLNRLNADGTFTRYMHDPNDPHSIINNKVGAIFEDSRGIFWVGTGGDGLHTMDRKTGQFERHLYDPEKPDQLSRPPLKPNNDDKITFITGDSASAIWIGTVYSGINRYDTVTKKITHYENGNGFPDNTSWNAFSSRDGVLWITTEQDNLYRVDPFQRSIYSIPIVTGASDMLEDKDGYLWVGTFGKGLLKYDQHKKLIQQFDLAQQFKHDSSNPFKLLDNTVFSLFQNQEDSVWVGAGNGLRILNTSTQQFTMFHNGEIVKDSSGEAGNGVTHIFQDKKGLMWFSRWQGGLICYNPKDNSCKHFLSNAEDTTSLGSNSILNFLEDKSGVLWIGGMFGGGINRLNRETGRFKRYMKGATVFHLYEDSAGNLWAGTDKSLYRYDQNEDRFTAFFDPLSEINSFNIGDIIEDDEKNLWLHSESNIIKLNPATKETFIYGSKFGISPNSIMIGLFYKTRKGEILLGHEKGFYAFLPGELSVKTNFKILITDLFINTLPVLPVKGSPIQKPAEEISDLDLKYNQNNIAFNFAAIDYREPGAIKYFTMLENYDDTWREAKGDKSSYYFNVSPGKYVYRVKAFDIDGTKAEKAITIHINLPWWETWWFLVLSVIALIIVIYTIIRERSQKLKAENIRLEEKVDSRTAELKKSLEELKETQAQLIQSEKMASLGELTAGVAHEIQNPLNFVNNFSEVSNELLDEMKTELMNDNKDDAMAIADDVKQNLEKILHHGKRAEGIVKSMLQHSRVSAGKKEATDINALCDEYLRLSYHGLRAKDPRDFANSSFKVTMKTDFDESIGKINIVPSDIGRVLLNLINNAFYAVSERKKAEGVGYEPTVLISTKKAGDKISISVKDNGNGVPQKIVDKIFQPFYTTKPTGQGTGLGLSLSYDIVKAHGGELKVESNEGDGAEFVILLKD